METAERTCPVHGASTVTSSTRTELLSSCPIGTECELFRSVFTLNTLLMRVTDRLTGDIGLTGSRWLLLSAVVWTEEPPTITELSKRCILSVQNVSRMVAAMESEGLLERDQVAGEGRAVRVVLTSHGREVLEGTVPLAQRLRERFLHGLDEAEIAALGNQLEQLVSNLMRMEQELSE